MKTSDGQDIKISKEAKDFIKACLDQNSKLRLGSQGDVDEIFSHSWLSQMETDEIINKKIKPEYVPQKFEQEFDIMGLEHKRGPEISQIGRV